jgi:hypothetical protein
MSLTDEAWKRAADLADSAEATTDPVHRHVLANLRNLWIAIAEESTLDDEAAGQEVDETIQAHASRVADPSRLH